MGVGCWLLSVECWVPALGVGCGVLSVRCWVLGVGFQVLGVGCWVLCVGCWVLGAVRGVLGVGCWVLSVGCCVLGAGCWELELTSLEVKSDWMWLCGTGRREEMDMKSRPFTRMCASAGSVQCRRYLHERRM